MRWLLSLLFTFFSLLMLANNLAVTNASVEGKMVRFDISWDNSWNLTDEGGNRDAVWLFLKGRTSSGIWEHINLASEDAVHYAGEDLAIEPVTDGKGVFVMLNAGVFGNVSPTQISISATPDLNEYNQIRIFAIEMVYIPKGPFYLGDGVSISSLVNTNDEPVLVSSEEALDPLGIYIHNPNTEFTPTQLAAALPYDFPKGFDSFYVMKYEISQLQYADFLNTLTYNQQKNRTSLPPSDAKGTFAMVNPYAPDSLYRNGIAIFKSGKEGSHPAVYGVNYNANSTYNDDEDGVHRAANFLNWADLSAYLDWAALRPITEMEYEKICRGANILPVEGELAWGTSLAVNANTVMNDGTIFETVTEKPTENSGLANFGNVVAIDGWGLRGVLRTGFAATASSSRIDAGAAYYGVMEMSGNVWEQTIMIGAGGELFTGLLGDGSIDENGNANQQGWCNPNTALGVLIKGGAWGSAISDVGSWRDLAVSDRFYSHLKPSTRRNTLGGRGGR